MGGYISQYFCDLVGSRGNVIVFEPGANNRKYIERNVIDLSNTEFEVRGVSNFSGKATFLRKQYYGSNQFSAENNFLALITLIGHIFEI